MPVIGPDARVARRLLGPLPDLDVLSAATNGRCRVYDLHIVSNDGHWPLLMLTIPVGESTSLDMQIQHLLRIARHLVGAYRSDLSQIAHLITKWFGETTWASLNERSVNDVVNHLRQKGYTDVSIARKMSALRSFFLYLTEKGVVSSDPANSIKNPKVSRTTPGIISPEEINKLIEAIQPTTPEALRDKAMIELAYATGIKAGELVSLDVPDLNLDQGKPWVRIRGWKTRNRTVPIHDQALRELQKYFEDGRPFLVRDQEETALFVNRRGERLTRQGFWLRLKGHAKTAGFEDKITPFVLRHSFATHMIKGGMPLRNVQEILGHSSINTTQAYAHLVSRQSTTREVYERAHPRA